MSPDLFGWISADLSSFHWIYIDFVDSGHRILLDLTELVWISAELTVQIWVNFYKISLDLGGCNRFEWIWVDLGGLELV